MPRQRQPRHKEPVAIPTNSLVASAVRYSGKAARIFNVTKEWQKECYRHYAICGEARFAAKFFGHALSRAVLKAAKKTTKGLQVQTSGKAFQRLEELFNGKDGQAQMLSALGTHLTIAGECYLVGREVDGEDMWEIVSVLEMRVNGSKWSIHYGEGYPDVPLSDEDVVIRIWIPNPAQRIEADSPFRSLLPILQEIEWLTKHIFAQTQSRLAGAGLLMLPEGMQFPPPPPDPETGKQPETNNSADAFMLTLADAMLTPIEKPESASAMVPIVVTAPDEAIDKAKLMQFWSEMDSASQSMRQDAIHRFALGMDLPPEQVLGMSSNTGTGGGSSNGVSHWGAWQIEESTIKLFVEPMLEVVVNALTIGYIRPLTRDVKDVVTFDTSALRLRPDRSKEAAEAYDRGELSAKTYRAESGFTEDDAPTEEEFKTWLLKKVATGSATPGQVGAALKLLGVDVGDGVSSGNQQQEPNESRPDPSLIDHPTKPRDPSENPDSAALLAASDALVFRALERAGNRIRQKAGTKPPGVPAYEMHTLHHVNGQAAEFLHDAWSCAPQVLENIGFDVDATVNMLDAYCKSLMHSGDKHSRERLESWLNDGIERGQLEAAT